MELYDKTIKHYKNNRHIHNNNRKTYFDTIKKHSSMNLIDNLIKTNIRIIFVVDNRRE